MPPFPAPPLFLHQRLRQHPTGDGCIERCRAQVHVSLRRPEILMTCELLNRTCGRPSHGQMRTERVAKNVNAGLAERAKVVCGSGEPGTHAQQRYPARFA